MHDARSDSPNRARLAIGVATVALATLLLVLPGCGGDDAVTNPTDVTFGETTFVFLVNPVVNAATEATVPTPGSERSGVDVAVAEGPSGATGSDGVLALSSVDPGTRSVSFDDASNSGSLSLEIADRDLREVAVALDADGAAEMANVEYAFGGEVVVITPEMSVQDVNDALARSNIIVFVEGGTYTGNVEFSGSAVTLFGEGAEGGNVTIEGDVLVSGSGNRLRGIRVTGDLSVPGSDAGISFSSVVGNLLVDGSDTHLLDNAFCGDVSLTGSGLLALDNAGLEPIPAPSGGC